MYCNGVQSYRRTNITTSDPVRLVIMCYEGVIDNLKLAKENVKEKNYEKKAKAITKAQDIINELLCSLNFDKGGVIASNLGSLYNYMLRRILYGDVNRDMSAIDEVIDMLSELLSAWQKVSLKPDSQLQSTQENLYHEKRALGSGYISE